MSLKKKFKKIRKKLSKVVKKVLPAVAGLATGFFLGKVTSKPKKIKDVIQQITEEAPRKILSSVQRVQDEIFAPEPTIAEVRPTLPPITPLILPPIQIEKQILPVGVGAGIGFVALGPIGLLIGAVAGLVVGSQAQK